MLEKLELIELEDEESGIRFEFPPAPRSGRVPMELRDIHKRYGDIRVFRGVDLAIEQGDRIAFVGVNGAGKSTMAKIIAGVEPVDAGERIIGHNITLAYFAQHQAEELNPSRDVLGTVDEVAVGEVRKHLRNLLGCFLFRGDDVFKKVGVLSGGEKSRLALAKMLLQPCNLIVLDEPTNHLDMRSKAILQNALAAFEGSFVIVSHDRDFLDPIVNKVVEFKGGRIRTYPGNVSDYLEARSRQQTAAQEAVSKEEQRSGERDRKRFEAEVRQRRYRRTSPIQKKIDAVEQSLAEKEQLKTEMEHWMGNPEFYKDGERVKSITAQFKTIGKEIEDLYFRWNELTRELEMLTEEFDKELAQFPGNERRE